MSTRTGRRWAAVTAVSGTVFIASGAFWLSFLSLADLAARSGIGSGQAWAWPLIVDGIIVVATVAVVALAGHRSAWYPWVLLVGGAAVSVTANALHAVVAADADVPGVLAAAVAAVPPVVLLAITHLTVVLTRPGLDPEMAGPGGVTVPGPMPCMPGESASGSGEPDRPGANLARPEPPRLVSAYPAPASAQAVGGRRERAGELRGRGWSNRQIAREFGVHPSTVGRWFAAAHLPAATEGEEHTDGQP